jgi:AraC family transcriptional regulator
MAASSVPSLPAVDITQSTQRSGQVERWRQQATPPTWRKSTIAARRTAVDRVILEIRERLDEPLSLRDMADIAYLSPFHFNRVFTQVTGVSPCRFLTALRIEAAKHLLVTSAMRVTDVCFAVGYNSLGTFTTQFTQLVGLSPRRYRRLYRSGRSSPSVPSGTSQASGAEAYPDGGIEGWISAPDTAPIWIFVGLFPTPVPSGEPVACALLTESGLFRLAPVSDGVYHIRAAAISRAGEPSPNPLFDDPVLYVAADPSRLLVRRGLNITGSATLELRPMQLTDPPILVVLPALLSKPQVENGRATA